MGATHTAHADHAHDAHHHEESFISKYVFSQDHKMIGKQFLVTAVFMAWVAVMMSLIFRLQLAWPGEGFAFTNFFLGEKWAPGWCVEPGYVPGAGRIPRDHHGVLRVDRWSLRHVRQHADPLAAGCTGHGIGLHQHAQLLVLLHEQRGHVGLPLRGRRTGFVGLDGLSTAQCATKSRSRIGRQG